MNISPLLNYFVLYMYRCNGLMILETYTTMRSGKLSLPDFLTIQQEVTGNPQYSMYNLSVKDVAVGQLANGEPTSHQPVNAVNDVKKHLCNGGDHRQNEVV
jgi:hypothetical protein